MRTQGMAENTIRRRTGTLRRIEEQTGQSATELASGDITSWIGQYPDGGTRAAYFGDLECYYEFVNRTCDERELVFTAPTRRIKRPRQPKRAPRPITTDELYAGIDTATGDVLDWIRAGAYQGCRVTEASMIAGQNISGDRIRIFGKGGSDKTIPLHPELAEAATRRPGHGWWFPGRGRSGHITSHTVAEKVCAHFDSAGVQDFTFHRLRHWCATEMLRAGASLPEVQVYMRHEVIGSTVQYTQILQDEVITAAARLPRRDKPRRRLFVV